MVYKNHTRPSRVTAAVQPCVLSILGAANTAKMDRAIPVYVLFAMMLVPCATAYNILFFPLSERTHMIVHLKMATELATRDNKIYFMTAVCHHGFAERTARRMAPNATLHFIQFDADCEQWEEDKRGYQMVNTIKAAKGILNNVFGRVDAVLSNGTLMEELQQLAPDLDLMVNDILSYGMLLASKLKLQYVDVDVGTAGALWEPIFFGADPAMSYIPAIGTFFPTNGMKFWQRCVNVLVFKVVRAYVHYAYWHPNAWLQTIIRKHNLPLRWPYNHYMLLLTNSNFITEPPRAIAPNTKYIGPILPEPAQPLPSDLAAWVEASGPLGTVFVSFGGTLEAPLEASRNLIKIMQSMPDVRFVWKLRSEDQDAIRSDIASLNNALVSDWVPQNDLLGHPKVKAFVTQGGYLSVAEASYHAVPMLGMPFIPGQGELISFAEDHGRAKLIPGDTLVRGNAKLFKQSLMELLMNESYQKAAAVTAQRLRATPQPYKQVAADWIEYAAELKDHGPFLTPYKVHQWWYQQVMLDVMLFYAALLAVPLCLVWRWIDRLRWSLVGKVPRPGNSAVYAEVALLPATAAKKAA